MFPFESWIVMFVFLINLIFMLVMSFVSPYYKALTSEGLGRVFNIIWLVLIIVIAGVIFTFNAQCLVKGGECSVLSWTITGILVVLTISNIAWGTYNTIKFSKKESTNVKQEHRY